MQEKLEKECTTCTVNTILKAAFTFEPHYMKYFNSRKSFNSKLCPGFSARQKTSKTFAHTLRKVCPATGNDRVRSRYLYLKNLAFCQFDFMDAKVCEL